jgi:hydroxymethyl cephem carbamoyltransferase
MALAAYGSRDAPTREQRQTIEEILDHAFSTDFETTDVFSKSPFFRIGVESQAFKDLAWNFSQALFDRFYQFAKENLTEKLPLVISGGCGLNCDWNTQWRSCGLFSDVFVPPCPNDSGIALGTAIDALHHYTGRAKITWSVYAGDPFLEDVESAPDFDCRALSLSDLCRDLLDGDVVAWVQGRWELGPRALGNRSMIAAPFSTETRDKVNRIKQREAFRPIAPICLEEEFDRHFHHCGLSPHMLYFQRVKSPELAAITHVDGTARAQTVNDAENPLMCSLLREFRSCSGVGVLCNTSLNFKGRGFINRQSQLLSLARSRGIDGLVVGERYWKRRPET